ncbi:hypothetical protein DFH09DRAFT_1024997, partial [Mycena vulgaris]
MQSCWSCGAPPFPPELPPPSPSVDLAQLLTRNDVPQLFEIQSVLQVISDSQGRLNLLDAQIESVQATLAQLARDREETAGCLRQHKAIISPVRRVPPELLCEIFSLTLPWKKMFNDIEVLQSPWRLGHVCAPWRDAAIGYPPLWRVLEIQNSP